MIPIRLGTPRNLTFSITYYNYRNKRYISKNYLELDKHREVKEIDKV